MTDFDSVNDNQDELVTEILEGVTLLHEGGDSDRIENNNSLKPLCIICQASSEL